MNFDEIPWSIGEDQFEGNFVIVRFRNFASDFPRRNFPQRLNIFWKSENPTPAGLPAPSDSKAMETFEDRLVEAVENDEHSVLTLVLTGKGLREYVFQTSSPQEFVHRLSQMPQEEKAYPIQIQANEDTAWDYFEKVATDFAGH